MVKKARLAETVSASEKVDDPRARIIAAAREVFIEQSFDLATVREITLRADVNLAAVNYYFGSKDELISEVLNLMMEPYTNARLRSLEACEAAADQDGPSVAAVVEALVRPMVRLSRDESGARPLTRFLLQVRSRPREMTTRFFIRRVDPVVFRFIDAFARALPSLGRRDIFWRYNFAIGAIMQVLIDSEPSTSRLKQLSGGLCDTTDDEQIIAQLVSFVCAGFASPAADPTAKLFR
ncbi:TetR/AcrR family transcriptional regulator [Methylocella sp. CPCC 101449]|uniref:TetR/AcrR family transcriptional regulator n=1 Tax=Methylocella sp. CPCC 101449 TaxID=2987531 RepID=UPI00288EEB2B|nr:TetR/AcrR family transcriptional regulator [Methylocella sp. CPCC 101449]MDT2019577.1 TetR family transcriptional regulator [Methylocella sp. CPCC 101449]